MLDLGEDGRSGGLRLIIGTWGGYSGTRRRRDEDDEWWDLSLVSNLLCELWIGFYYYAVVDARPKYM